MENPVVYQHNSTTRYMVEFAIGLLSLALALSACSAPAQSMKIEASDLGDVGDASPLDLTPAAAPDLAQRDMTPVNTPDLAQPADFAKAPTCGTAGLPCCSVNTGSGCDSSSACMMSTDAPRTFLCVPTTNSVSTCDTSCAAAFAPSQTAQIAACIAGCVGSCGAFHESECEYDGRSWCGWCNPQTTSCPLFSSTGAGFMEQGLQGCGSGPQLVQP